MRKTTGKRKRTGNARTLKQRKRRFKQTGGQPTAEPVPPPPEVNVFPPLPPMNTLGRKQKRSIPDDDNEDYEGDVMEYLNADNIIFYLDAYDEHNPTCNNGKKFAFDDVEIEVLKRAFLHQRKEFIHRLDHHMLYVEKMSNVFEAFLEKVASQKECVLFKIESFVTKNYNVKTSGEEDVPYVLMPNLKRLILNGKHQTIKKQPVHVNDTTDNVIRFCEYNENDPTCNTGQIIAFDDAELKLLELDDANKREAFVNRLDQPMLYVEKMSDAFEAFLEHIASEQEFVLYEVESFVTKNYIVKTSGDEDVPFFLMPNLKRLILNGKHQLIKDRPVQVKDDTNDNIILYLSDYDENNPTCIGGQKYTFNDVEVDHVMSKHAVNKQQFLEYFNYKMIYIEKMTKKFEQFLVYMTENTMDDNRMEEINSLVTKQYNMELMFNSGNGYQSELMPNLIRLIMNGKQFLPVDNKNNSPAEPTALLSVLPALSADPKPGYKETADITIIRWSDVYDLTDIACNNGTRTVYDAAALMEVTKKYTLNHTMVFIEKMSKHFLSVMEHEMPMTLENTKSFATNENVEIWIPEMPQLQVLSIRGRVVDKPEMHKIMKAQQKQLRHNQNARLYGKKQKIKHVYPPKKIKQIPEKKVDEAPHIKDYTGEYDGENYHYYKHNINHTFHRSKKVKLHPRNIKAKGTIYLCVTIHGSHTGDHDGCDPRLATFQNPVNTFKKLTFAPITIYNYGNIQHEIALNNELKIRIPKWEELSTSFSAIANDIKTMPLLVQFYNKLFSSRSKDPDIQRLYDLRDQMFKPVETKYGDVMCDKIFVRRGDSNSYGIHVVFQRDGQLQEGELFEQIRPGEGIDAPILLSELLRLLSEKGYQDVIMFDASCASFDYSDVYYKSKIAQDRQIRRLVAKNRLVAGGTKRRRKY